MMELIHSTNLYYRDRTSDKVYQVELCKIPLTNHWNINFAYGRRLNITLKQGTKNNKPLVFSEAKLAYEKLIQSKLKKGYEHSALEWISNNKERTYGSFAVVLVNAQCITPEEYTTVMQMLQSDDPEITKLAELIIESKEKQRWEQN